MLKYQPIVPHDDSLDLDHIQNSLAVVDYMITASSEDRHDLAQHHASVPRAVLQALVALTSASLDDSASEKGEYYADDRANDSAALGIISCLKIFANMSNVSPAWSRDIQSTEGSLTALARTVIHRESIASNLGTMNEKSPEADDSPDGGEILCLVLAIVTSAVLVEEQLASVLASLGKLPGMKTDIS